MSTDRVRIDIGADRVAAELAAGPPVAVAHMRPDQSLSGQLVR